MAEQAEKKRLRAGLEALILTLSEEGFFHRAGAKQREIALDALKIGWWAGAAAALAERDRIAED